MNRVCFSLESLYYTYPNSGEHALSDITMDIPHKQVTAVLGPNGAGKSTLMDLLLGWRRPETGAVRLFGRQVGSYPKRERGRLMSLVPQNEPIQFSFSLLDYVMFARAPYLPQMASPSKEDRDIALNALETVHLDISPMRSVTSLSGGERQLLMLARAIAQQPEVILLDEPTSSLDPGNTARTAHLIRRLKSMGMAVIYTTHDPNLVADTADHVAMLKSGRLISMDETAASLNPHRLSELYDAPMNILNHQERIIVYRSMD
jgi:iron complex transport system ATP-binding protein